VTRARAAAAALLLATACTLTPTRDLPPARQVIAPPPDLDTLLDAGGPAVRLAMARGTALEVSGRSLTALDLAGGRGIVAGRPGEGRLGLALAADGGLSLDGIPVGAAHLALKGAGPIAVAAGGAPKRLRGRVEVVVQGEGLMVVNELPLERYLAAVVPLEMDAAWPAEALKAQAVASRTYALNRREARRRAGAPFDLEASVQDQVYGGADAEDARAAAAVLGTRGEWLADEGGRPILAAFHSTAGGHTESSADVWQEGRSYLVGAPCPFDRESPAFAWRLSVPVAEVERRLVDGGHGATGLARLAVRERTASGRARKVAASGADGTVTLPATELRRLLGYGRLKSTAFEVRRDGDRFAFEGRGSGHGVGLCQWGARGMAGTGHDYRAILARYYPGARLVTDGLP
jgi:stage II sporulation protein D